MRSLTVYSIPRIGRISEQSTSAKGLRALKPTTGFEVDIEQIPSADREPDLSAESQYSP